MTGKKGRSGPPAANLNSMKNGTRITRLVLGTLPTTMRRQTKNALAYRRDLEALVLDVRGEVNVSDAHLIDEACNAELHASVCRWLMRTRLEKMSVSDVTRCSEQVLKSKTIRNKAVECLELDAKPDPWGMLDAIDVTPTNGDDYDDEDSEECSPRRTPIAEGTSSRGEETPQEGTPEGEE